MTDFDQTVEIELLGGPCDGDRIVAPIRGAQGIFAVRRDQHGNILSVHAYRRQTDERYVFERGNQ